MLCFRPPRTLAILSLLVLPACRDSQPPTTPLGLEAVAEPALAVAHAAGDGFSFLAPLVKGARPEGGLDRTLSPVVEVCRPAGLGCSVPLVAQFTTGSTGSERVRLEKDGGEHYHVNWHTRRFDLDPAVPYRIRVRVGGSTLGQLDVALVEKGGGKKVAGDGSATVKLGSTVPIKFHIGEGAVPPPGPPLPVLSEGAAASATIGPGGGTLTATDQGIRYTLEIPADALPRDERITMTPLLGVHNFPLSGGMGAGVDLQPDGLTLYRAARLTIELPSGHDPGMLVGFGYVDGGEIFYARPVSLSASVVSMPVHHFSGAGAAGATVVDLEQIIANLQALGRTLPSKLYPATLVVAQVRLFAQVCGGPPKNCTPNEADQVRNEYQRLLIDVLDRWYADGLVPILADATTDDRALRFASQEFFTWVGTLMSSPSIPPTLHQHHDEGRDHLARGILESIERFAEVCNDTRVLGRWNEAKLADLLGREEIPADESELARRYTCLSFEVDHPASMQAGEMVELKLRILHEVGGIGEFLPWPNPIRLFVVNGCGVVDGVRFLNDVYVPEDPSRPAEVQVTADDDAPDCEEVEIALSTDTWTPHPQTTRSPPLDGVVFGAEDRVRIPIAGPKIAFTKSAGGVRGLIHTVAPDGSGLTALAQGIYARWAPDGDRLVFLDFTTNDLRVMDADGSNRRTIARGSISNPLLAYMFPAWSPDGTKIAFTRRMQAEPGGAASNEIFTVNADGSGLARVTDSPDYFRRTRYMPTWSPDGTRIAYAYFQGGTPGSPAKNEIHVVNAGGGGLTIIDNGGMFPDWSSDGRIAYLGASGGVRTIHLMNGDGSSKTDLGVRASWVAWSPDGERIAFNAPAPGGRSAIFVMNMDGSGITQVPGTEGAGYVDW